MITCCVDDVVLATNACLSVWSVFQCFSVFLFRSRLTTGDVILQACTSSCLVLLLLSMFLSRKEKIS